jgi:hypothetical protein
MLPNSRYLLVLDPPVVPLPVPCEGERYGSVDVEPAPDGDDVLLGNELVPDAGALAPAPEPCTLEDVPVVGGQEQFAALVELPALAGEPTEEPEVPLTLEGELEELLALGDAEDVLALGVELDVLPTLEGDDDELLALEGELLLPLIAPAPAPVLEVPPAPEVDAPGGQVQFSAPPAEPLVLEGELEEPAALGVLVPLVEPAPVELLPIAPPELDGCELCVLCDWPVVLEDCA